MGEQTARVRLVRTPGGQRIEIQPGFMLGGTEAILRHEGDRLVVEPVAGAALLAVLDGLDDIDVDWPEIADPPPDAVRV